MLSTTITKNIRKEVSMRIRFYFRLISTYYKKYRVMHQEIRIFEIEKMRNKTNSSQQ